MRISAARPALHARRGLEDCSKPELLALAEQECICAVTRDDAGAQPCPTATWPAEDYYFRFQPPITYPEPGWLEWLDQGRCMIERAPSGSYEEDWRRAPRSTGWALHLKRGDLPEKNALYVTGDHAMYARDRRVATPPDRMLTELAAEAGDNLERLRALVDCEFSYARRRDGGDYVIELSTLPWLEGQSLGCGALVDALLQQARAAGAERKVPGPGAGEPGSWSVQTLWLNEEPAEP
jgi:hypothetical protein